MCEVHRRIGPGRPSESDRVLPRGAQIHSRLQPNCDMRKGNSHYFFSGYPIGIAGGAEFLIFAPSSRRFRQETTNDAMPMREGAPSLANDPRDRWGEAPLTRPTRLNKTTLVYLAGLW
jgi:hypothetical protein